jgi:hypothetical protein
MWRSSFVATTVAMGGTVDDALAALDASSLDASANDVVSKLQAPQRTTRANALATSLRDIVVALDEGTLR